VALEYNPSAASRPPCHNRSKEGIAMDGEDALVKLNHDIAAQETAGERKWFEDLLAPQFAMRRASLEYATGEEFLAKVAASAERRTDNIVIAHSTGRTSVVTCTVQMRQADKTWAAYNNVRLFTRDSPDQPWQLLAWANESAGNP
jgi:hypothetical protein